MALHTIVEHDTTHIKPYIDKVKQALNNEVVTRAELGVHNLFNYDAWKSVPVVRGTAVFENNGVTLTATENDCITRHEDGYYPVDARIPVKEGQKIVLKWTTDEGSSKRGFVYIFPNGSSTGEVHVYSDAYKLEYTPTSGIEFITFRVGVGNSGNTIHYRNIMVTLASDSDPTYQPYAMTNKELTDARFLSGTIGIAVTQNFTEAAEYTIPADGWYLLLVQTNSASATGALVILLGSDYAGNFVANHRNSGIQYENCSVVMPLKAGTKVIYKCTDTAIQCQYRATPLT